VNVNTTRRRFATPLTVFIAVFLSVFLLVVGICAIVTFTTEKSFESMARVKVDRKPAGTETSSSFSAPDSYLVQTELELIRSEVILKKVVEELDLNAVWGKKYYENDFSKLKTWDSVAILRGHMDIQAVRNANIIDIGVLSDNPDEAAKLANAILKVYCEYAASAPDGARVRVLDPAYPDVVPVRPRIALNLVFGTILGVMLSLVAATIGALITFLIQRKEQTQT